MKNKLNLELAREYYKLAPMASVTNYALLVVTLIFYWGMLPATILLTWAGVNFIGATSFFVAVRLFKRYGTENNAVSWLRIYAYLVLFQEAPWGLIGPISFMIDNELYRMLTLFMLGGMGAGAIISRAPVFKIYVISLVSLLTPIIITLALQRTTVTDAMLALVLIYLLFMLSVAKSYSSTINRNIRLWLDNEQLVEQLRRSHAEVEQTNRVLTQEIEYRKEIEVELTEAKERSEQASEAKNQFLATVSHELRTPLNGIMGFADLLLEEKLESSQQHYVSQISKAGHTLLRIVNDILDITAIEAGHIRLHKEPFSLRNELDDLVSLLRPMAERKKLLLESHVDEAVEDGLYGDISRLRQIVSNLLSNALKYTETGRVSLTITQLQSYADKLILRFEIEDTGIGIAADALNTIFENFSRVENFETRRNEGAGLGLPIVEALLQKMEGRLFVNSIPGKGSCFSFELPLVQCGELHKRARHVQISGSMPEN
jgi:signal transduction histidine kinase